MPRTIQPGRLLLARGFGLVVVILGWIWWRCQYDPQIIFLPHHAGAEWIRYPNPSYPEAHQMPQMSTVFRRSFVCPPGSTNGTLQVSAYDRFAVSLNGVALTTIPGSNWKLPGRIELGSVLREGTNTLTVTVTASNAPPLLWLAMQAEGVSLGSDARWEASLAGAAWRPAGLATEAMPFGSGHAMVGSEQPWPSLQRNLPTLLLGTVMSLALLAGCRRFIQAGQLTAGNALVVDEPKQADPVGRSMVDWLRQLDLSIWLLLGACAVWLVLFLHNDPLMPRTVGFDAPAHLDYIQYIQTHHRLPLPSEGWSMFHPPLYYTAAAGTLGLAGKSINDESGVYLLRLLGLGIGLAHLSLVWASLRLLFPGELRKQAAGMALATFLPAHLCLAHFVSNELLAATLVTASFYLCLRLLRTPVPGRRLYVGTGVCLGAALLAKMTAILAIPFVVGMVLFTVWRQEGKQRRAAWLGVVLSALACGLVAGWYYGWIWWHFGTPLVGNWDAAQGAAWWQDEGYRTSNYYLRFGRVFTSPFFSGFNSCADGLYSTLWGDGLFAGMNNHQNRPPWNYDWMAAVYLLSLGPVILLVVGAFRKLVQLVRTPKPEEFVLVGFTALAFLAFIFLTLKVPSYAQVKAFYLLSTLLPMCVFMAEGWEGLIKSSRVARGVGLLLVGAWAFGSISALWVHSDNPSRELARGFEFYQGRQFEEAARCYGRAVARDPQNMVAGTMAVRSLVALKRVDEALTMARLLLESFPQEAAVNAAAAEAWLAKGQPGYAYGLAQQAIKLEPDNLEAHLALVRALLAGGKLDEMGMACREALRIAPENASLHHLLGVALLASFDSSMAGGNPVAGEARQQLRLAGALSEGNKEILGAVAWILATHPDARVRDGAGALTFALASTRDGQPTPKALLVLAVAQAEAGKLTDAVASAERAQSLLGPNDVMLAESLKQVLKTLRAGQPFHEVVH